MKVYLSSLKKLYHEFLLIKNFFNSNPAESTNITNFESAGLLSHFNCCNVMSKAGCANFEFHNIVSNDAPAARFNSSKTNILELMGFIMKANGSRYACLPWFLKQYIQLYNSQIQQMMDDYCRHKENNFATIGYSIIMLSTEEFQQSDSHEIVLL